MHKKVFILLLTIVALSSCRTAGPKGSELLLAPETNRDGQTTVSSEAKCEANGGEFLSNFCVCEDGSTVKNQTCAQHIKKTYPECYAKGGISKKWDGRNVCMCEHGEIINPKTQSKTCYQLFTEKNRGCAVKFGILGVKDRACKCMHGKLTYNLPSGQNCLDDFKAQNKSCADKGGVTLSDGGPCVCRDGTYADGECSEKWFFYNAGAETRTDSSAAGSSGESQNNSASQNGSSSGSQGNGAKIGQSNSSCLCSHVDWRGAPYCLIYKVGQRTPLEYSRINNAGDCNLNHCYTHFQDSYQNACGGSVDFYKKKSNSSSSSSSSSSNGASVCKCQKSTYLGTPACELTKNGIRRFAIQVGSNESCGANFCQSRWGYDPYVRSACSSIE